MESKYLANLTKRTALFGVYFIAASIGLSFDAVSGFATLVWPPTGIALAAILIFGYRFWPSIFLAAVLVNFVTGAPFLVSLGIGVGNTLEALLGAYLLNRFVGFRGSLERLRDALGLIFLAALMSTTISATIGVSSLLLGGVISTSTYGKTWLAWWVGDVLGNLVIASLILVWNARLRNPIKLERVAVGLVPVLLLIVVSVSVFHGFAWFEIKSFAYMYLIFPILIWIALRFGQRGSVTAIFIVSLIAIWSTSAGFGSFAGDDLSQGLLYLQLFIGITAVTFMVMAAVVSERERTQKYQQRLLQRTKILADQRIRLMTLNKAKNEFVAIASHQLRTPATAVKQYVGLLLESYSGSLNKDQISFLEKAYESNEKQLRIVEHILQIAKLDLGKMELNLDVYNISKIIDNAVLVTRDKFNSLNQTVQIITPKKPVWCEVDGEKFEMVVENLLENASKYSRQGKKTTLILHQPAAGKVQITIEDEGIGIKQTDFKHLFKKFSRIDNPLSDDVSGSGLGLYFCKEVIKLHKGSINVSSELSKGSIFTIVLPYKSRSNTKNSSGKPKK